MEDLQNGLEIAGRRWGSRLIVGTGGFRSLDVMERAIAAAGAEIVTVALRRVDVGTPGSLVEVLDRSGLFLLHAAETLKVPGALELAGRMAGRHGPGRGAAAFRLSFRPKSFRAKLFGGPGALDPVPHAHGAPEEKHGLILLGLLLGILLAVPLASMTIILAQEYLMPILREGERSGETATYKLPIGGPPKT